MFGTVFVFFFFWPVFYSSDNFFQTLEKLVLHGFFGILAFSDLKKQIL